MSSGADALDFAEHHLAARLLRWEREQPTNLAYRFLARGEEEAAALTWAELAARTRGLAAELGQRSERADRVLILLEPGLDFVVVFLACLLGARTAVPVPPPRPREGARRLLGIVSSAAPRVLVTNERGRKLLETLALEPPGLGAIDVLALDAARPAADPGWVPPEPSPGELAFLQYTSGSTGVPKGVAVTHGNLLANERMIAEGTGQGADTVSMSWLPPHHDMGLIGNVLGPLYLGATSYLMSPLEFVVRPARWLRAISRFRATASGGPNFAYDLCVERITEEELAGLDLSSWRVAFCGAEPVRARTMQRFVEAFAKVGFEPRALFPCYGMAECTLYGTGVGFHGGIRETWVEGAALEERRVVAAAATAPGARSFVSCGRPASGASAVLVNPDTLEPARPDDVGEIWLAGPHVAAGYFRDPERTAQTFGARLPGAPEPFLRTGDLGFKSDDQLFVTGRLTEMIIVRGRNYHAEDVEQSARQSDVAFQGSTRSAAFACERESGEVLVVVQEVRRDFVQALTAERCAELVSRIRSAVGDEHGIQPAEIVLLPLGAIPCTTSGKVRRRECRTLFERGELPALTGLAPDTGSPSDS